jgi:TolB protein
MRRAPLALLPLLLALALAACGTLPWANRNAGPAPQANRLAVVDDQGDLFTVAPDGGQRHQLTTTGGPEGAGNRTIHFWPTWSPDGRWIAAARAEIVNGDPASLALFALPAAGGEARQLFGDDESLPFFYSWSPDARSIAVISQTMNGLALHVAGFDAPTRRAATGAHELYLAWSADSKQLVTHVDGSGERNASAAIRLHRADGSSADLPQHPSTFRAPAIARDGKTLYLGAVDAAARDVVVAVPTDGSNGRELLRTFLPAQFVLSPNGDRLAVARESDSIPGLLDTLQVIDLASGAVADWTDEPVAAFFWSPDGKQLAWIGLDRTARELALYVGDGPGAKRKLLAFAPSQELLQTLAYFDQYASTLAIWSPDSKALQIAGWLDSEHVGPSQIWVVQADGTASPRVVADGTLASWSPLAK